MRLSEILTSAAKAEAERRRRLDAEAELLAHKGQLKKVWEGFHAASEFVPRGHPELAARKWTDLLMTACTELAAAGEAERLNEMRYTGTDRVRMAGMEAAYNVCRLACAGQLEEVRASMKILIEAGSSLDSPFRLYLECVRDNRKLWMA